MNWLLPPLPEARDMPAFSELEEGLRGEQREQVVMQARQQLQALVLQLQRQMQQGVSPAEFRQMSAVQDACEAALELLDSV